MWKDLAGAGPCMPLASLLYASLAGWPPRIILGGTEALQPVAVRLTRKRGVRWGGKQSLSARCLAPHP